MAYSDFIKRFFDRGENKVEMGQSLPQFLKGLNNISGTYVKYSAVSYSLLQENSHRGGNWGRKRGKLAQATVFNGF